MAKWITIFSTPDAGPAVPRLLSVAEEEVASPDYHHPGRDRRGETQFLFKYTLQGEGMITDTGGDHRVPEGRGLLCQVNDPDICYYYPPGESRIWRFIYVTFKGEAAAHWTHDLIGRHGRVHRVPASSSIIQRMLSFADTERRQQLISPAWGSEFVTSLLLALEGANETPTEESSAAYLVRRTQELISENIERDINVKELSNMAGVSREHLTRVFSKHHGTTPHRYILTERMKYAGYLLRHVDKSIKEIAYSLGFESASHFARTFRRVMGSTPLKFRLRGTRRDRLDIGLS